MSIPTRAEVDVMVRERLAADPGFRARLTADPRATLSELVGMNLPEAVTVTVHEESLTSIHLVVPAAAPGDGQMSDADLELVAGGICWADSCTSGP